MSLLAQLANIVPYSGQANSLIGPNPFEAGVIAFEILAGIIVTVLSIGFIFYLLMLIAGWRILKKAGEPGWKILIPIYNVYMLWKIAGMKNWFWSVICCGIIVAILEAFAGADYAKFYGENAVFDNRPMLVIATLAACFFAIYTAVAQILYAYRTSKVFGHGLGYTIGLIILPSLFWLILGFGRSDYDKRRICKSHAAHADTEPVARKTTTTRTKTTTKSAKTSSKSGSKTTKKSSKK